MSPLLCFLFKSPLLFVSAVDDVRPTYHDFQPTEYDHDVYRRLAEQVAWFTVGVTSRGDVEAVRDAVCC